MHGVIGVQCSLPQVEGEEELEQEHGELMESILEDEEEIIALHRQQIEDAMEIVRRWGSLMRASVSVSMLLCRSSCTVYIYHAAALHIFTRIGWLHGMTAML